MLCRIDEKIRRPVIDNAVGTKALSEIGTGGRHSGDHTRADVSGQLYGKAANSACSGMDKDRLARLEKCTFE
jgi:hypothetical protein